jgi:hypothetical protein
MPFPFIATATRALALSAGLLIAGTALGAPVRGNQAAADCAQGALLQFNIDDAQCFNYPALAPAHGECRVKAQQDYASALAKCSELAASAAGGRETGVIGIDTIKPQTDAPLRGSRKLRDPALQLQQIAR